MTRQQSHRQGENSSRPHSSNHKRNGRARSHPRQEDLGSQQHTRPGHAEYDVGLEQKGFQLAADCDAHPGAFGDYLEGAESELRNELTPIERQSLDSDKAELAQRKEKAESRMLDKEAEIENYKAQQQDCDEEIEAYRHEDRAEPSEHHTLIYALSLIGLVGTFVFIILFYSSATYSLLYGDYLTETLQQIQEVGSIELLGTSILRPDAMERAFTQSFWAGLSVISFPLALLLVAVILHFRVEEQRHFKSILGIFFIGLIYDVVVAYGIDASIFEVKQLTGLVSKDESYTIFNREFWSVLVFGFLTYSVFSVALYYTLKALRTPVQLLKRRKKDIQALIDAARSEIIEIKEVITDSRARIRHIERILAGKHKTWGYTKAQLTKFFQGWARYIESTRQHVPERINEAHRLFQRFLDTLERKYAEAPPTYDF